MIDKPKRSSQELTDEDQHDVGSGVFATGSPREIADAVIAAARDEDGDKSVERRAMAKLTFYENRAGRSVSPERRATLEKTEAIARESA
jgi:pyridoxal biosynthesis lyase PdxS